MGAPKGNTYLKDAIAKGLKFPEPAHKYTDKDIDVLSQELMEWASREDAYYINEFCKIKKLHPQRISEFSKRNENFNQALSYAKMCIETNIFKGAIIKDLSEGMAKLYLQTHNRKEWHDPLIEQNNNNNNLPDFMKYTKKLDDADPGIKS